MNLKAIAVLGMSLLLLGGFPQGGEVGTQGTKDDTSDTNWEVELVSQLEWLAKATQEAAYFCALAATAPAVQDQRILSLRAINILEGSEGEHFVPQLASSEQMPGVIPRLAELAKWLAEAPVPEGARKSISFSLTNVGFFVTWALKAALRGAASRRVLVGTVSMRQAYAALLAALGPADPALAYLGGIRPLLTRYRAQNGD